MNTHHTPSRNRRGAAIELEGVTKTYGDLYAARDIDLKIEPGEFVTFLGPSGSGKTTTLNLIAGFTSLTKGEIRIANSQVQDTPPHKRNLGMVFQSYALFPHMTVWQNIAFPLRQRRIDRASQADQIAEVVRLVDLGGLENRYPHELSGGQQQRVAIARALVYRPNVLLLDEPLGALDKKLRESLQSELRKIHTNVGSTFVFVTHDQEEALSLSDRIAIFNRGRVEQVGTGRELYERPQTLFVGTFLGDSTIIHGTPTKRQNDNVAVLSFCGVQVRVANATRMGSMLLVRPERLDLAPRGEAAAADENRIPVTVTGRAYLGSDWKYEIELADGTQGAVRLPPDRAPYDLGTELSLAWKVTSGVLLEPDETSAETQ
ncbi:ABC transporter ATP-binding protein [Pelagibacterium lacus]|uniref:ABC transporter ATP-binding protein n=1 Tax=Pelagibacterium lacus TaxID=2282655 RepID=A0A369VZQ0_9HYPH|nr:ABC transporter ATP-binding protein [Pelagibacterium lacus]RDE07788.1 ABC transporter ATP-binding protein [Pelagibacterium lacus]